MKALLLIDIQNDYFKGGKYPLKGMEKASLNAQKLLKQFRDQKRLVIHIRHLNTMDRKFFHEGTSGAEIHSSVMPYTDELVIIKRHPNSFRETELNSRLKSHGITELHIAGAMTNMCVDSTVRAAYDMGYSNIVYENACAAPSLLGTSLIHHIYIKNMASIFTKIKRVK